ncbi:MAG: hypothetical protein KDH96_03270 [Candidatus Riesia sp.]|nr:hypothetical protein [Candidatus Riesia sp.]
MQRPPNGTLTPAYGRDYKSRKEVIEDWERDKDFVLNTQQGRSILINRQAYPAGSKVTFRFCKLGKTFIHVV